MAREPGTTKIEASVASFLDAIPDATMGEDCRTVVTIKQKGDEGSRPASRVSTSSASLTSTLRCPSRW